MVGACDFVPGDVRDGRIDTELGNFAWQSSGQEYPDGTPVDLVVRLGDFQIVPDSQGAAEIVSREFRGDEIILTARLPSGTEVRCRQYHHSTLPTGTRVTLLPTKAAPFVAFKR
jgi:hypothetical protein